MSVPRKTAVAVGISGVLMFATGAMAMTNVVDLGIGPRPAADATTEAAPAPSGIVAPGVATPAAEERTDLAEAPAAAPRVMKPNSKPSPMKVSPQHTIQASGW